MGGSDRSRCAADRRISVFRRGSFVAGRLAPRSDCGLHSDSPAGMALGLPPDAGGRIDSRRGSYSDLDGSSMVRDAPASTGRTTRGSASRTCAGAAEIGVSYQPSGKTSLLSPRPTVQGAFAVWLNADD